MTLSFEDISRVGQALQNVNLIFANFISNRNFDDNLQQLVPPVGTVDFSLNNNYIDLDIVK